MFLALNEIKFDKKKYGLVIGLMFLIAYLVYFLTGLAYGLALDNRIAVDQWQADAILLSEEANGNLSMSMIPRSWVNEVEADQVASIAQMPAIISVEGNSEADKVTASFFGIDSDEFLVPEIVEGEMFEDPLEVVADISLHEEYGLNIGDQLTVSTGDQVYTLVGFSQNNKYNVSPVIHIDISDFQELRYEQAFSDDQARINGIVTRGAILDKPQDLEVISIEDFIQDLPGYSAQVLTFTFMIGFLILIATVVIGIFIYVLTLQKVDMFGVMKAQGISNAYISKSVIFQTVILVGLGIFLGAGLTLLSAWFLPASVPFQINYFFLGVISVLMLITGVFGAFFSVSTIVKIDPAQAIA